MRIVSINNTMKTHTALPLSIDLNADLGEGSEYDEAILNIVSSANISCGAHAGDITSIVSALTVAKANQVVIGAHPSYPDRESMGRRSLKITPFSLTASIIDQLTYIKDLAEMKGAQLRYVKTHGALYNDMASDGNLAKLVCDCINRFDPSLAIMGLAGSAVESTCHQMQKTFIAEAFIDRRYHKDGSLLKRSEPGAVIHDADQAVGQALEIIQHQRVTTASGASLQIQANSLCLHGDSPAALAIATALKASLMKHNIAIRATL